MEMQTLQAEVREKSGKGPARQLRMAGKIPAVMYGPGTEPQNIAVSPKELHESLSGDYGRNQVIEVDIAGAKTATIIRDLEVDPVTRDLLHADFYAYKSDAKVKAMVPFEIHGRSIGVQRGGKLRKLFRSLPVFAKPADIPAKIELDVGALDIYAVVKVEDLQLPDGVEVTFAPTRRVLLIEFKEQQADEEEEA